MISCSESRMTQIVGTEDGIIIKNGDAGFGECYDYFFKSIETYFREKSNSDKSNDLRTVATGSLPWTEINQKPILLFRNGAKLVSGMGKIRVEKMRYTKEHNTISNIVIEEIKIMGEVKIIDGVKIN